MAFNYRRLKEMPPVVVVQLWTVRDTILYALGVGANELQFAYEAGLQALPTMSGVLASPGFIWRNPEYGLRWQKILHAEQSFVVHYRLPVEGRFYGETVIDGIVDKGEGKGAIIYLTRKILDEARVHVATVESVLIARGDGGFGGGDPARAAILWAESRAHDIELSLSTAPNQALIYRLSGDLNPLHIDPAVAKTGGFTQPILHGMCTYGVAGRALIAALCANDPTRLTAMRCRFSAPVYPGETIKTEIWKDADGKARFRARVAERNVLVLDNGLAEYQ